MTTPELHSARVETLAGAVVLVVDGEGPGVGLATLDAVLTASFEAAAQTVAVAVTRLDPAFFELRSGVAGEVVQRLANYRLRLAVIGDLPPGALASRSFSGFVLEGDRGDGPWFAASLDELAARLAR